MGWFGKKKAEKDTDSLDEFTSKIVQNAALCVEHFKDRFKLNFSEKSLVQVDELLEEASELADEISEKQKDWIVNVVGAYVFEVARKNYGGTYYWFDERNQPILVTGQPSFAISIVVFDKIRGRIENGIEDHIPYFFEGFGERVKSARPGDRAVVV